VHEWPLLVCRAAVRLILVNVGKGPFMLVGARSFGRIAAMRLTAARSPERPLVRSPRMTTIRTVSLPFAATREVSATGEAKIQIEPAEDPLPSELLFHATKREAVTCSRAPTNTC
jgi:hypothetical protein